MMGMRIKDARVIVTGGAAGIGFEYCRQLLFKGAKSVTILDMNDGGGKKSTEILGNEFGKERVLFFHTDVSNVDQFNANFKKALTQLGGLDIVINNAGILDDSRWSLEIDINLKGLIQGTILGINAMGIHTGGKGGTIINVASTAGLTSIKSMPVYSATKFAVIGFSNGVSQSFDDTGVAIKVICPGATDTPLLKNLAPRYLNYLNQNEAINNITTLPCGKVEDVAKDMMRLIEEAPNGSIWLSRVGIPISSIEIPHYLNWATPM